MYLGILADAYWRPMISHHTIKFDHNIWWLAFLPEKW
jgi:hypothetical protein